MDDEDYSDETWSAHEALRRSIYEGSLALREAARRLSLVLLASFPSVDEKIIRIRNQLVDQVFGEGHLIELVKGSPFVAPTVVRFNGEHVPDSDVVAVGAGSCAVTLTPWSCPLLPEVHSAVEAKRLLSRRADVYHWLSRLSRKSLACNCKLPPNECWAWILK